MGAKVEEEEENIQNLKKDLERGKQNLNDKMIELQKLEEEFKRREEQDLEKDEEIDELKEALQIYTEIEQRLDWELSHMVEKKRQLNNEFQILKGSIRVNVRVRDFAGKLIVKF